MPKHPLPLVSVLMPFYNEGRYLDRAISSVLSQSYLNLQLILIDDNSTDNSLDIAERFARVDKRITIIRHEQNKGGALALAAAVARADGDLIARHDADDWSAPTRIERQVAFLQRNESVSLCGTFAFDVHPDGTTDLLDREISDARIKIDGMFRMPLLTTTTMGRRELFVKHGCEDHTVEKCGDYCLYALYFDEYELANIPDILMYKQVHAASATGSKSEIVRKCDMEARRRALQKLDLNPTEHQLACHERLAPQSQIEKTRMNWLPPVEQCDLSTWTKVLREANERKKVFESRSLEAFLDERLKDVSKG
ncbi:hypothetical protein F183_A50590 [Bryobacterales bacterium F-183]|nr:hypothetical protein F183_A50590 [Bryobacterales bacterium F-183]